MAAKWEILPEILDFAQVFLTCIFGAVKRFLNSENVTVNFRKFLRNSRIGKKYDFFANVSLSAPVRTTFQKFTLDSGNFTVNFRKILRNSRVGNTFDFFLILEAFCCKLGNFTWNLGIRTIFFYFFTTQKYINPLLTLVDILSSATQKIPICKRLNFLPIHFLNNWMIL